MKLLQETIARYRKWSKENLMITPPELLLILVVLGLITTMVIGCIKFTKITPAIAALKNYLNTLYLKLNESSTIDAEAEREKLDILVNNVKASCDRETISNNMDLKMLMERACKQIKMVTATKEVGNRSDWQKLKDASFNFNELYYRL